MGRSPRGGSVPGLDRELILVAEDARAVKESQQRLTRVGIERVGRICGGWHRGLGPGRVLNVQGGFDAWSGGNFEVERAVILK